MPTLNHLDIQYITDAAGEKSAVILPIAQFYELLEDLEDLAIVAERRNEDTLTHQQVLEELKNEGLHD